MENVEDDFVKKSADGALMVTNLIQSLGSSLVYPDAGNFETNRKLWNMYASEWDPEKPWVREMAGHLGTGQSVAVIGDEWSLFEDLRRVVSDFIAPHVHRDTTRAIEIGCGGGRVAQQVSPLVASLLCCDISSEMLTKARTALEDRQNVDFQLLESPEFPAELRGAFDFVYCFDVMVHMDLHLIWRYLQQIKIILKDDGRAFISTANLLAPGGFHRFERQQKYTVGGFYFISPDIVRFMLEQLDFKIVKTAKVDASNVYYNRDFLVMFEHKRRKAGSAAEADDGGDAKTGGDADDGDAKTSDGNAVEEEAAAADAAAKEEDNEDAAAAKEEANEESLDAEHKELTQNDEK